MGKLRVVQEEGRESGQTVSNSACLQVSAHEWWHKGAKNQQFSE